MNKPHFETWLQENLVKFCQDAYEKLCAQEQELQLLRLHTCSRRATTREEKIVRPGVYDVCQCVMDEREDNAKLCEHLGAQDYGTLAIAAAIRRGDADHIHTRTPRLAQPHCDDCGGTDPECPLVEKNA